MECCFDDGDCCGPDVDTKYCTNCSCLETNETISTTEGITYLACYTNYQMSCGVNRSSLFKWLLLQNCLKINGTALFSSKSFPLISAGPPKASKIDYFKIKYEKVESKILIPR